ncbi:MAG TPA: ATP-binding protein [Terriglobia bacterium]|nr:ATP-binding protein [Terriglobia bacterium]
MLVIVCGPPCTGKSTIADALERNDGLIHLEVDRVRERVLPDSDQRQEHRDIAYRSMHSTAEYLIRAGQGVIVNATYNRQLHRKELAAIQGQAFLVQCKAPLDLVISRFRSRPPGHPAVDLTEEKVLELWTNYAYSSDGLMVDTSQSPEVSVAEVRAWLDRAEPAALTRWAGMR